MDNSKCSANDVIAQQAAQKAVEQVFYHLGVDVKNPAQVEEFRKDLRFGGQIRRAVEKGVWSVVVVGIVIVLSAAWFALSNQIGFGDN